MDEPTSALTSREVDQLFALIERLIARGVAIVYITHRLDEVVSHRPSRDGAARRPARRDAALAEMTVAELVRLMANRDLGEHFPETARTAPGAELLRVEHLGRGRRCCTTSASSLRAGEVVGIGGLLGAGRTELARVLAGADRSETRAHRRRRRARSRFASPPTPFAHGIGLLPEDRKARGPRRRPDRRAQHRAAARPPAGALRLSAARAAKRRSPSRSSTISASRPRRRSRCGC